MNGKRDLFLFGLHGCGDTIGMGVTVLLYCHQLVVRPPFTVGGGIGILVVREGSTEGRRATARLPPGVLFVATKFAEIVHGAPGGVVGDGDVGCGEVAAGETDASDVPSWAHSDVVVERTSFDVFVLKHCVVILARF